MTDEAKEAEEDEKTTEINNPPEKTLTSSSKTTDQKSADVEVLSFLRENAALLNEIKEMIHSRLEYDAVKEKAFDKLYEEMSRQKGISDLLDRSVKPILSDLLLLFDSMKKYEASLVKKSMSYEETLQNFRYVVEELLEILYRQEVIPVDENISEPFNSRIHKATKTENAECREDDFKVISIVRSGFTWRDKVLRPQDVVIKRFLIR